MQTSPTVTSIFKALVKAQASMPAAEFDKVNPAFKSKYASQTSVSHAALPSLNANDIAVLQGVSATGNVVSITTRLAHASGEWIEDTLTLTATQTTPQGIGSAITYGKRYALAAMVGVVADDDEDGNAASEKPKAPPKTAQKPETKPPTAPGAPLMPVLTRKDAAIKALHALGYTNDGIKVLVQKLFGRPFDATTTDDITALENEISLLESEKRQNVQ